MPLDLPTLLVVSTCITALLGLFLFYLWIEDRSARALGWWAAAYLIGGFAVALWSLRPLTPVVWLDEIAPALLFVCGGMIWCGARKFHGKRVLPLAAVSGGAIWLLANAVPAFAVWNTGRVILSSVTITIFAVLTAIELRQERRNPQTVRIRAAVLPILHAAVFLSPILTMDLFASRGGDGAIDTFPLFALLTLLYVVGTAFVVVVIAKERSVLLHKTAALTDALTGLFNRRGFFEAAQKVLAAQSRKSQPVTVLMFDLDRFKSINDRFGHQVGDETLRVFATTASRNMRVDDVVGRLGGEEFAAILPGGLDSVLVVAERVRAAFEANGAVVAGYTLSATVSIGAAVVEVGDVDLAAAIGRADAALYRAKSDGRNRIVAFAESCQPQMIAPALVPDSQCQTETA